MTGYAFKLAGLAILVLVLGFVGIIVFGNIWARVGFGAAAVVVFGALLLLAWYLDRREKAEREEF